MASDITATKAEDNVTYTFDVTVKGDALEKKFNAGSVSVKTALESGTALEGATVTATFDKDNKKVTVTVKFSTTFTDANKDGYLFYGDTKVGDKKITFAKSEAQSQNASQD